MAYIALFDILGFKQAVIERSIEELKEILGNEFNEMLNVSVTFKSPDINISNGSDFFKEHIEAGKKECSFVRFSDTILLYSDETDLELGHIIFASNRLIAFMILKGLPVRGALTKGELFVDEDNSLVLGEGLIRAYELEQSQQWSGGIIDPDRISIHENILDRDRSVANIEDVIVETRSVFKYPAPFKTECYIADSVWCFGWPGCFERMPVEHLKDFLYKNDPLTDKAKDKTINSDAKDKFKKTVEYFKAYKKWITEPLNFVITDELRLNISSDR